MNSFVEPASHAGEKRRPGELGRDDAKCLNEELKFRARELELVEEGQRVQDNQADRDERRGS